MILIQHSSQVTKNSSVQEHLSSHANSWQDSHEVGSIKVLQTRVDPVKEWGRAISQDARYTLWLEGRPFPNGEVRSGKHITAQLLDLYQEKGNLGEVVLHCDGGATLFLYDLEEDKLTIATDILGLYPVYDDESGSGSLSTHSDWLADQYDDELELDGVSIVEQVTHSSVSPPYTLYKKIREIKNGSLFRIDTCGKNFELIEESTYWEPNFEEPLTYNEARKELAEALKEAVELRTSSPGKKTVLLSGGADSRLILGANKDAANTGAITLADRHNQETEISKKLAKLGGIEHEVIIREDNHYSATASDALLLSGGMGCIMDNHILSLMDDPRLSQADVILTGCHGDYFFKSVFTPKISPKILGKRLPIHKVKDSPFIMPRKYVGDKADLWKELEMRWDERLISIGSAERKNINCLESSRVLPLSREIDSAFRSPMARVMQWDPLFYSQRLINMMWRIPSDIKMEGRCYEQAVSDVVGLKFATIKNANYGSKLGANKWIKTLNYLVLLAKKAIKSNQKLSNSSWPNYGHLLNRDESLQKLWMETKEDSGLMEWVKYSLEGEDSSELEPDVLMKYELMSLKAWANTRNIKFNHLKK